MDPQGTKLGPVLFILMINDLQPSMCLTSTYVDDTSLLDVSGNPQSGDLQVAATETDIWSKQNDMKLNPSKTKYLLFDFSVTEFTNFRTISIGSIKIDRVKE